MESVDLDVNQFFKAMESVLGRNSQEEAGNDAEFDRKSSSSDMDFGICFLLQVMQKIFLSHGQLLVLDCILRLLPSEQIIYVYLFYSS